MLNDRADAALAAGADGVQLAWSEPVRCAGAADSAAPDAPWLLGAFRGRSG
ncbi:hypothetical protein LJK87_03695 [Paenibacillus sp. P25]|nr:hypothetical protein LJK87_03695 [Paenibacillus sp. P25]